MINLGALALLVFCWALGSLLSALHACLENVTGASLEGHASTRPGGGRGPRARAARAIVADLEGHAHAVALARIVCNLGLAVSAVFVAASLRGRETPDWPDALVGVGLSAFVLFVFSVALAEAVGRHAAERTLYAFAPLARATFLVQTPLSPLAGLLDRAVRLVAGTEHETPAEEVASEIMSVAEEGEREGVIDEDERRMIEAVVNFKLRTVEQIMTPRNEVEALEFTNNLGQITAFVRKVRHSRIPVYRAGGSLDDVIGFFYVKDLLRWLAGDGPKTAAPGSGVGGAGGGVGGFDLKAILRPALHVPESKTIRQCADEFVAKKVHAAVVVDEYGAVMGLVTMEDIVEEVFGDIQDEYEKAEDGPPTIEVKLDDDGRGGVADMDARAYVGDANRALEPLGVTLPESDDYDTVGGFVLWTLGHMPEVNETFNHGLMQVTVLESTPTRVLKVRVHVQPPAAESPPEGAPTETNGALRPEPAADRAK